MKKENSLYRKGRELLGAKKGSYRVLAFCVRKGKIISVGYNSYIKTHPKQAIFAKTAGQPKKEYLHAEVASILKAKGPVDSIYIIRTDASGNPALAAPCPVCRVAIRHAGIKKIFHT